MPTLSEVVVKMSVDTGGMQASLQRATGEFNRFTKEVTRSTGMDRGLADMQQRLGATEQAIKRTGNTYDTNFREPLKRGQQELDKTGRSIADATRGIRALSGHLLSELSPAMGSVVQSAAQAGAGFAKYGAALTAVTVGIAVAVSAFSTLVQWTNQASKSQAAFNLALRSGDIGALRGQLKAAQLEMETYARNTESIIGRIQNLFTDLSVFLGAPSPGAEKARAKAGIAELAPLEATLNRARSKQQLDAARAMLAETSRQTAEIELNADAFEHYTTVLQAVIDREFEAAKTIADTNQQMELRAAIAAEASQVEIAAINDVAHAARAAAEARRAAQTEALRRSTTAGRGAFTEAGIERVRREVGGGVGAEGLGEQISKQSLAGTESLIQLNTAMRQIKVVSEAMGSSFDENAAQLAAVKRAIMEFNPEVENAARHLADLQAQLEELKFIETVQQQFEAGLEGLRSGLTSVVQDILAGTATVEESFARMGRAISASLIENVINQGLKLVQEALNDFIKAAVESGLIKQLLGIAAGFIVGGTTGTISAAGGGGTGGLNLSSYGPAMQGGGIVTGPTRALIGEAGPEAVIPLSHGALVQVNIINQHPNAEVSQRTQGAGTGHEIHDLVIKEISRAAGNGELESVLRPYAMRRVPTSR